MKTSLFICCCTTLLLLLGTGDRVRAEQGRAFYDLGVFAYEDQDYEAAEVNFRRALSVDPGDPYYNHYLGKTLMQKGDYQAADRYLEQAYQADRNIEELKYDYAYLKYKTADYPTAADLFQEIAADDPSNVLARYYAGISLYHIKRYQEAITHFVAAAEKSPTIKANGYYYAGICHYRTGDRQLALQHLAYARDHAETATLRDYAAQWIAAIEGERSLDKPYRLYARIGYRYDDNVRLEPLYQGNLYADEGDFLALGQVLGGYNFVNRKTGQLGAGLTYYQTRHNTLYEYDLTVFSGDIYGRYRMGPLFLGLAYLPARYWVNAEDYMVRHQVRPRVTWSTGGKLTTRLTFNYFLNDFQEDDERDGDTKELTLDGYYSVNPQKFIVFAGIGYEDNYTENDDYAYARLKTKMGASLKLFQTTELVLTGYYNDRQYADEDSTYQETRKDQKFVGAISLSSRLIWDWLRVSLDYDYTDNQSNIDVYTYKRNRTTLSLSASY